jgi:hypothetical protein
MNVRSVWQWFARQPEFATCPCDRCNGEVRPTSGMLKEAGVWYCSQAAADEHYWFRMHGVDWHEPEEEGCQVPSTQPVTSPGAHPIQR